MDYLIQVNSWLKEYNIELVFSENYATDIRS